jgi:hypothetical protein
MGVVDYFFFNPIRVAGFTRSLTDSNRGEQKGSVDATVMVRILLAHHNGSATGVV